MLLSSINAPQRLAFDHYSDFDTLSGRLASTSDHGITLEYDMMAWINVDGNLRKPELEAPLVKNPPNMDVVGLALRPRGAALNAAGVLVDGGNPRHFDMQISAVAGVDFLQFDLISADEPYAIHVLSGRLGSAVPLVTKLAQNPAFDITSQFNVDLDLSLGNADAGDNTSVVKRVRISRKADGPKIQYVFIDCTNGRLEVDEPQGPEWVDRFVAFDNAPSQVSSFSPASGATGVSAGAHLQINFATAQFTNSQFNSAAVQIGEDRLGAITIYRSNGTVHERIPVTDGRVSFNGSQVTINPNNNFATASQYYVKYDVGTFDYGASTASAEDDHAIGGIFDSTTWRFTTAALAPTLNAIPDVTINEDAAQQTVNLSGITAGGSESQPLRVTATSNNTGLVPNPSVTYSSAATTGSLKFTPVANKSGTATITVTVTDGGIDGNLNTTGDNLSFTRTFNVTVNAVNDVPTLDIVDDLTFLEDSPEQTVSLAGITAGGGETQSIRITASSDNTDLIPVPVVEYTSPDATGTLKLQATPIKSGAATVTITVEDGGLDNNLDTAADNQTLTRTFVVNVTPIRPIITSPGLRTDSQRPLLEWNSVPGAVSYEIWIGNSSTGENPYVQGTAETTSFNLTEDLGIGKMDFWVRARKADETFLPWTRMHRFNVTTPPDVDDVSVRQETARPNFTWPAVPGAVTYDLWVNNHSTGESQIFRQSLDEPTWTPPQDLPMSRYRMWTRAVGPDGFVGSWSIRTSFYTVPAPQAISPVLSTFDRTPAFDWSDVTGADSYGVFVRSLVDGTIAADIKDLPTSEWTPDTDLAPGLYVWQASADSSVAGFRSAWTPRQEFYVGGLPTITSPISPAASTTPLIEWREVTGAGHYILQVNGQVEGAKLIYRDDLTTNSFQVETPLASGGTYRVWVKAVSTTGEHGPWTGAYVFTVAASQIDQSQEALPNNVLALLDQNPLATSSEVVPERPASRTVPDGRALAADQEWVVEEDVSVTPIDLREPAAEFVPDDNSAAGALLSHVLPRDWFEQVAEALEI